MASKTRAAKTTQQSLPAQKSAAGSGRFRSMVKDGQGGWREATQREVDLNLLALEWSLTRRKVMTPEIMAHATVAYDAAMAEEKQKNEKQKKVTPVFDRAV